MRPENPNGVKSARKDAVECATEQKNQPKSHGLWHKREGTKPNLHPLTLGDPELKVTCKLHHTPFYLILHNSSLTVLLVKFL